MTKQAMPEQTIEDFAVRLDADPAFAGQFIACLQPAPEGEAVSAAVDFAAANGFTITADEMRRFLDAAFQRNRELSDCALDEVAGGRPVFATTPGGWTIINGQWRPR